MRYIDILFAEEKKRRRIGSASNRNPRKELAATCCGYRLRINPSISVGEVEKRRKHESANKMEPQRGGNIEKKG